MVDRIVDVFLEDSLGAAATPQDAERYRGIVSDHLTEHDIEFLLGLSGDELETAVCGDQEEMVAILARGPEDINARLDECFMDMCA